MKQRLATHAYGTGFPVSVPSAGYEIMETDREMDTVDQQLRMFDLLTSPEFLSQQQQHSGHQQLRYQATVSPPQFPLSPPLGSPVLASPLGLCPVTSALMGPVDPLSDPLPLIRPDLLLEEPLQAQAEPPPRTGSDHVPYSPMQDQLELFQKMLQDSITEQQVRLHTSQQQLLLPLDTNTAALAPAAPWQPEQQKAQQQQQLLSVQQQQQVQVQPQTVWMPHHQQQQFPMAHAASAPAYPAGVASGVGSAGPGGRVPDRLDTVGRLLQAQDQQQQQMQQQQQQQQLGGLQQQQVQQQLLSMQQQQQLGGLQQQQVQQQLWSMQQQQQQQGPVTRAAVHGPATPMSLAGPGLAGGQVWPPTTSAAAAAAAAAAASAPAALVKMEVGGSSDLSQQMLTGHQQQLQGYQQPAPHGMLAGAGAQAGYHPQQQQLVSGQCQEGAVAHTPSAWAGVAPGGSAGQPPCSTAAAAALQVQPPSAGGAGLQAGWPTPPWACAPPGHPASVATWDQQQWGPGQPESMAAMDAAAGSVAPQAAPPRAAGPPAMPGAAACASSSATGASLHGGFKSPAAAAAAAVAAGGAGGGVGRTKSGACQLSSGSTTAPPAAADAGKASGGSGSGSAGAPLGAGYSVEEEEAMKGMTVMQRYHYKRKLNMQRMEQEVAAKLAQLSLLEKENKRLRWQARVLENMVADIDKQLEVMTAAGSGAADAGQWIALLGVGRRSSGAPRPVHRMLEGAYRVDITTWELEDFTSRWTAYVQQLQPLMAQVRQARAAWKQQHMPQEVAAGAAREQAMRAAVAAAAADAAKAGGLEDTAASTGGLQQLVFGFMQQQQQEEEGMKQEQAAVKQEPPLARGSHSSEPANPTSSSTSSAGEHPAGAAYEPQHLEDGRCVWGGPGTEGVPLPLLCEVEGLVMSNFEWLLALLTRNHLATFKFVIADFEGAGRAAPPAGDPYWRRVVGELSLTPHQMQEASMCLQLSTRCREQVRLERERLQQTLEHQTGSIVAAGGLNRDADSRMEGQVELLTAMQRNVWREAVVRNMVGLYCINVLTLLDLATISVEAYPFFCNAWAVIGAVAEVLREQQAAPKAAAAAAAADAAAAAAASRSSDGTGAGYGSVTTRSSTRRAKPK